MEILTDNRHIDSPTPPPPLQTITKRQVRVFYVLINKIEKNPEKKTRKRDAFQLTTRRHSVDLNDVCLYVTYFLLKGLIMSVISQQ